MPERLLRPREFQLRLGIARSTFFAMKARGLLPPPVKLGKRAIAFTEASVDEFIKSLAASGGFTEN